MPNPPSEPARRPCPSWRAPSAPTQHPVEWHEQSKVFPSDCYQPPRVRRGGTEKAFAALCTQPGGRERPAGWAAKGGQVQATALLPAYPEIL